MVVTLCFSNKALYSFYELLCGNIRVTCAYSFVLRKNKSHLGTDRPEKKKWLFGSGTNLQEAALSPLPLTHTHTHTHTLPMGPFIYIP